MTLERFESQNAAALIAEKIAEHLTMPEKRQYFKGKIAIAVFSVINFLPGTSEEFSGIHSEFSFVWGDYGGAEGWLGQHTIPGFTPSGILQPVSYSALNGLNNNFTLGWSQGQDSYYGLISIFNTLIGEMQVAANDFIGLMGNPGLYFDYVGAVVWAVATEAVYKLDFPSWASVPSWYHFATLIKADGTTEGKQIAALINPPLPPETKTLPANRSLALEIWRQDPAILTDEVYDYFPRHLLQYTNLMDEFPDFPDMGTTEDPPPDIPPDTVTPIVFYSWGVEPGTDQQFTDEKLTSLVTFPDIDPATGEPHPKAGEFIFDPDPDNGDIMPDSKRVREIHAALEADKFAYGDPDPTSGEKPPRVANLGYYLERLARVLGISVNPDGSIRSVRQRRVLPATGTIAAGWGLGQWELNEGGTFLGQVGGNEGEERDGYAYVQRSNVIKNSVFNQDDFEVAKGNIVLCENLMQLFESYLEDLDKGLNWQEMGGAVIPNADTTPNADGSQKFCSIEGMGTLLAEVAYMLSAMSKNTSQTFISSLVTQAITQEILEALGQPLQIKYLPAEAGDPGGDGYRTKIPFPGLSEDAPTVLEQIIWVLQNVAQLKGALGNPVELP